MQANRSAPSSRSSRLLQCCLALGIALWTTGCAALSPDQTKRVHATHWRLIAMDGQPECLDQHILLRIGEQGQLFGQMNASTYFGSYKWGSGAGFRVLNVAPIQRTVKVQTAPDVIRYLKLILRVDSLGIGPGGHLILKSNGRELLRYEDTLLLRNESPDREPL